MDDDQFQRMLADIEARQDEMHRRMAAADVVEAVGVVQEVTGFSASISIKLSPWRWTGGPLESGGLYVRKQDPAEGELRRIRYKLPRFSVVRLRVRPDTARREAGRGGDLWDAQFEEIIKDPVADPELERLANELRESEPPPELGKPRFDLWWLLLNFLARSLPEPVLPIIRIGAPLPKGNWWPENEFSVFEECEEWYWNTDSGTVRAGVSDGVVEGVLYDYSTYRNSGVHRMKKLQTLLSAHSEECGKLHRILDNQQGAMMYRTLSDARFAIYAYNVDRFIVHSHATSYRSR